MHRTRVYVIGHEDWVLSREMGLPVTRGRSAATPDRVSGFTGPSGSASSLGPVGTF